MLIATPELTARDHEVIDGILELRTQLRHALAVRQRWVGVLRRVTMAQAIRSSNSIEGYHVSAEDALAAVDDGRPFQEGDDTVAWDATLGYRRAMTYVLQLFDDPHFALTTSLLRSLHFMLVEHDLAAMPGRWRPGTVFVNDTATGAVVYEGPPPELVDELSSALVSMISEDDAASPLVRGAMAHLNLVVVHPFKDGNGRLARILQSLVLAREGILAPEFCSIEEYLGRHTRDYYDALAVVGGGRWGRGTSALPFVRLCLTGHARQAKVLQRRTLAFGYLYEEIDAQLARFSLPARAAGSVFLAGFGYRITNETYRSDAAVTAATASRDLRALTDAGLLTAQGEKRGRSYVAAGQLKDAALLARQRISNGERIDPYDDPDLMADPYA